MIKFYETNQPVANRGNFVQNIPVAGVPQDDSIVNYDDNTQSVTWQPTDTWEANKLILSYGDLITSTVVSQEPNTLHVGDTVYGWTALYEDAEKTKMVGKLWLQYLVMQVTGPDQYVVSSTRRFFYPTRGEISTAGINRGTIVIENRQVKLLSFTVAQVGVTAGTREFVGATGFNQVIKVADNLFANTLTMNVPFM